MLLSEIKEALKKYEIDELKSMILEMYKAIPKKLREDKDIDALLMDFQSQLNTKKIEKTTVKQPDMLILKAEIDLFISHAYKQYYFAPNNYVHKKERPKWRFKVKAFINELQSVPYNSENGKIATDLMEKLYAMLSYACGYYLFNSEDPFKSVGIVQTELLDIVIKRKFLSDLSNESVKSGIRLVIDSYVDRVTLHSTLIYLLISNLKTPSSKELAIDKCKEIKADLEKSKIQTTKKSWGYSNSEFEFNEKINNLVEMVFLLYIELFEYDTAIKYFNKFYIQRSKEVLLYVMLGMLSDYELKDYWLREYEDAVKKGVTPRDVLSEKYKYIRKNDKFPDDIDYLLN